jgi:hypothetical protein
MPLFRNPTTGQTVEIYDERDIAWALSNKFTPVDDTERAADLQALGQQEIGTDSPLGSARAFLSKGASALSLGITDQFLDAALPLDVKEQLVAEQREHDVASALGEGTGSVLGALATGGSALARTPAGYLGSVAAREVEAGLAHGGVAGTARALGAMGTEGALQSAGQYLGQSALQDTEATVEGLTGALGTGFAFGAGAGGALLGVQKGLMSARNLYARHMDGGEKVLEEASSAWTTEMQARLDADELAMQAAKTKLDDIGRAKAEAKLASQRAAADVQAEKDLVSGFVTPRKVPTSIGKGFPEEFHGPFPEPHGPIEGPREAFGPFEQVGPLEAPRDVFGPARPETSPTGTQIFKRTGATEPSPAPTTQVIKRGELDADAIRQLEAQSGADMNVKGSLTEPVKNTQLPMSADQVADGLEGQLQRMQRDVASGATLADMRASETEAVLGKKVAFDEAELFEALEEFEKSRKDLIEGVVYKSFEDFTTGPDGKPYADPEYILRQQFQDKASSEVRLKSSELEPIDLPPDPSASREEWMKWQEQNPAASPIADGDFSRGLSSDVTKVERYEKASAKLVEVLGDAAPEGAKAAADAYAEAADDSMRNFTDRQVRALEDVENFGPTYATPKERVKYKQDVAREAKQTYAQRRADETEAKLAYDDANKVYQGRLKERQAATPDKPATPETKKGRLGAAADAFAVNELLDIPGMPKAADLPIVGPLLGAYLKYRGVRTMMGKAGGRIPATADAKIAALAARTKDRIAKAVDSSLGLLEKRAGQAARVAPSVAGVLTRRLYDDGGEDAPEGASVQEVAAVRMRELAAYVAAPNAIEMDVRRELRDVRDPRIIVQSEKVRRMMMEYLLQNAPKMPEGSPLVKEKWLPSAGDAMSFARRYSAINDPGSVFEDLATGDVSLEGSQALRDMYPRLFQMALERAMIRSTEIQQTLPYRARVQLSRFYGVPLDASLRPDNLEILQNVYQRKPAPQPAGMPGQPPMPAIADATNLTGLYQTSADRRAAR